MDSKQLLNNIIDRQDLTSSEAEYLLGQVVNGSLNPSQVTALLIALRSKGETVDEIVGLIRGMRKHMVTIKSSDGVIDTCGTGGDGRETFNISTAASFVVAACGVKVAKHGNRAASSKSGSADVMEALGVNIMLTADQAEELLEKVGMVFLFAPLYHPAVKRIAPIRKELGVRTVFNFLGPFLNPADVGRQLIGVPNPLIAKKLAHVAAKLGYKHAVIVSGKDGMDEISLASQTHIFEIKGKKITSKVISPSQFKIKTAPLAAVAGGDAAKNSLIIRQILNGKKGAHRDVVVLNSAYALRVGGKIKTVQEGIILAERVIDSGAAMRILQKLIKETKRYA